MSSAIVIVSLIFIVFVLILGGVYFVQTSDKEDAKRIEKLNNRAIQDATTEAQKQSNIAARKYEQSIKEIEVLKEEQIVKEEEDIEQEKLDLQIQIDKEAAIEEECHLNRNILDVVFVRGVANLFTLGGFARKRGCI